ncbi:hypothetical protein VPH35_049528 [Triticum aestivum]|uniref:Uncharacterized protein n=1 Tax=Triticum aestivum TaxID=4565 RepID=A0A077RVN5_WHEAT|nr:unnamed protein product [Triticum aestivum]
MGKKTQFRHGDEPPTRASSGGGAPAPPSYSRQDSEGRAVATKTAKVVDIDGSMAQFAAPVTAREALDSVQEHRPSASVFLCSSDELRFDVPARALAAEEALQPGWLYFVLPMSTLRRSLSGLEMAALAARASSALAVASGVASSPRRRNGAGVPGTNGKRRKAAARASPAGQGRARQPGWASDRRTAGARASTASWRELRPNDADGATAPAAAHRREAGSQENEARQVPSILEIFATRSTTGVKLHPASTNIHARWMTIVGETP